MEINPYSSESGLETVEIIRCGYGLYCDPTVSGLWDGHAPIVFPYLCKTLWLRSEMYASIRICVEYGWSRAYQVFYQMYFAMFSHQLYKHVYVVGGLTFGCSVVCFRLQA